MADAISTTIHFAESNPKKCPVCGSQMTYVKRKIGGKWAWVYVCLKCEG
jgi:hypothetical protein